MSEIPDRRRRTDLDLFVLALIESGISTPYQLQKAAGLSQGATIPTLQRLVEASFVRQGKPGLRGRIDYKVTAAGKTALMAGWLSLIEDGPSGDLDADLRVALLALWIGGDHRASANFLQRSAIEMMKSINLAEEDSDSEALSPLAHWYNKLRYVSARSLFEAESNAARAMAAALPRSLSKKVRGRRTAKLSK